MYDFDSVVDRTGTGSLKYDFAERRGKAADLLPLWVADMDFPVPDEVKEALKKRIDHGVFGYSEPTQQYFDAVATWFTNRHGWTPKRDWMTTTPGVVYALACCVRAYTQKGEGVIIMSPVYYPFSSVIEDNGRVLRDAPLLLDDETLEYSIDFDALESLAQLEDSKVLLLCNPHNPCGRVWTRDELARIAEICAQNGVIVVSDEIHADFARDGYAHTVFASISEQAEQISVICTAASKSFNLAGLQASNIFIPNPKLRYAFQVENGAAGYSQANVMGLTATQACYELGGAWFDELKAYIDSNYRFMVSYFEENIPQVRVVPLQSTYLVFVDCRALGLDDNALERLVEDKAKLWLDMGNMFGEQGSGFARFNIACPRSVLAEACERFAAAVQGLSADLIYSGNMDSTKEVSNG